MSRAVFHVGDTFDVMATMPDDSVDLVLTSPPFLALRSYLPADHPDKSKEIGSEPSPAEFIDTLLAATAEWGRLLTEYGSIAVELGDTYSGSGGAGGDYNEDGWREGQAKFSGSASKRSRNGLGDDYRPPRSGRSGADWPEKKSMCLIPQLYAIALSYGINPLTGAPSPAGRWRVRNVVRWVRPNPPVGSLADKYRPATSEMVIACKSEDRWFDLDAVRKPLAKKTLTVADGTPPSAKNQDSPTGSHKMDRLNNPAGAPPLDWWEISPSGYSGSHYAVFPPELCEKPIESMCPRHVCTGCGEPRRRLTSAPTGDGGDKHGPSGSRDTSGQGHHGHRSRTVDTVGWSVCDCETPEYRPGIVLDPFGGSGTVGAVATGRSRDAVLIDIDERNLDLARERIGMFLEEPARC